MNWHYAVYGAFAVFAALTWVFRIRPYLDERDVARDMRREARTSTA